ncbi:MAG: tetratricopeptide repeat protein [Gammaproteobacteria bacterium]|nr:tetratricopeptide repeat protein [Gammaproteobacteria bacterium]
MRRQLRAFAVVGVVYVAYLTHAVEINVVGIQQPLKSAIEEALLQANKVDALGGEVASHAWGELGMLVQSHNLYEQAIEAYSRALQHREDDILRYLRGISHNEVGNIDDATLDMRSVSLRRPGAAIIWFRLAELLYKQSDIAASHVAATQAIALDENLPSAYVIRADIEKSRNELKKAKKSLVKAHELAPDAGQVIYRLAVVERELGNLAASKRWLELRTNQFAPPIDDPILMMVAERSLNGLFFESAARRAYQRGDNMTALAAMRRAIELEPKNINFRTTFASFLLLLDRDEEAENILKELIRDAPESSGVWERQATLLARQEKYVAAYEAIQKSLAIESTPEKIALANDIKAYRDRVLKSSVKSTAE